MGNEKTREVRREKVSHVDNTTSLHNSSYGGMTIFEEHHQDSPHEVREAELNEVLMAEISITQGTNHLMKLRSASGNTGVEKGCNSPSPNCVK